MKAATVQAEIGETLRELEWQRKWLEGLQERLGGVGEPADPRSAAAPKCTNRACAEWRKVFVDHLRTCGGADPQDLAKATAPLRPGPDGVPLKVEPEAVSPGQPIRPGVIGAEPAAEPLDLWPVIKLGRRVRLHPTGKPGLITRVDCSEGVGTDYMATLTIDFDWDAKAARYVPPTRDGVGEVTVTQGLPTNDLPLPAGYKVPDRFVTVTPQGVGSYAAPQAARCGACHACRGKTAQPACERELVATREAVRRLWCHVQAVNPAGLDRQSAGIHNELRREIEALACVAEVK